MTPLFRFSLTYGLILGLVMIALDVLTIYIAPPTNIQVILEVAVLVIAAVFFLRHYKEKINDGSLIVSDAVRIGMLTGFSAGIITGFAAFIQLKYIDPSGMDQFVAAINADHSMTDMEKSESIDALYSPLYLVSLQCFALSLFSVVIFLVVGLFLKKEKTIFEDNKNQD